MAFAAEQEAEWLLRDGQLAAAEQLFREACLPGGSAFRQDWLRVWLMLARGEGAAALAVEQEAAAAYPDHRLTLDHTPRLIEAYEQVGDVAGVLSTTERLVLELAATDSPLLQAGLAATGCAPKSLPGGPAPRPRTPSCGRPVPRSTSPGAACRPNGQRAGTECN